MKPKQSFELDEDTWCIVCNALNLYDDINKSFIKYRSKPMFADWENQALVDVRKELDKATY